MKGLAFQDPHLMRSSSRSKLFPKFLAAGVRVLGSNCFVCCGGFGSMASLEKDPCFFFGGVALEILELKSGNNRS